tara:strand:+ start:292 stop:1092 length:801 start_codon:yes stop_codon:yes gene_type:complete
MLSSLCYVPEHVTPEIQSDAWVGHTPFAHWLINRVKPDIFVELGTHGGGSYFAFCDSVLRHDLKTQCHAVDTWKGDLQAGYYGDAVFNHVESVNKSKFSKFSKLYRMTFDDALKEFDDGTVDLLHIDGFHSLEAVSHDFATWRPKLTNDALVLFHDTQVKKENFGVHKFWSHLCSTRKRSNFEFFHSHGLGVFCNNPDIDFAKNYIPAGLSSNDFRGLFEMAGNRVVQQSSFKPKKMVTPDEVLHLVKVLSAKSEAHRQAIAQIVA